MDGGTIFAILVGLALAVFSLVMVAYSFFRGSSANPGQAQSSPVSVAVGDDNVGLDSIYDSIDTLELEYQLGNLPEEQSTANSCRDTGWKPPRPSSRSWSRAQRRPNCCWSRK